ncbi:MAG: hypothetical protein FJZ90_06640 [Chloroflexi bacterium]|nr:hypothetical protein [Chloroflexota bacterium]
MSLEVRLGIAVVASPLEVGAAEGQSLQGRLGDALAAAAFPGLQIVATRGPVLNAEAAASAGRYFQRQGVHALCIVAASWFEDYLVADMLEECAAPVIAWARPGMETGALCGTQQLGYLLKQLGHPCLALYGDLEASDLLARVWDLARAASLRHTLRRARIGFLGHRVEGMTDTTAPEIALKKTFGPRLVGLDTVLFLNRVQAVPRDAVWEEWRALSAQVGCVSAGEEAGLDSLRAYHALRDTIEEQGLSAVAVGCYPHLMGKVCLAASLLGEEGVPVACEGDVNGALGMLMLTRLAGLPVHNTDLLDPIPADNAIVFSHCGSGAFSLAAAATEIELGPVRLMHTGVCCRFPARPGPTTLLHIGATPQGYRMAVLFGEAVATDMVFPGNPLKVRFASSCRTVLDWIASRGYGHHWMATYGDFRRPLAHLATLVGCDLQMLA